MDHNTLRSLAEGKTVRSVMAVAAVAGALAASTTTAIAAEVNFGNCMSSIDPAQKPGNAPGQSGNGPLNSANGYRIPAGFDGAQGCN